MNNKKNQSLFARFAAWVEGDEPIMAAKPQPILKKKKKAASVIGIRQETERLNRFIGVYRILAIAICLTLTTVLLYTVASLPIFGDASNPSVNEVSERYIEQGVEETGAVNVVAGIILSYRIFDTFGESNVLFLAASAVMMLLWKDRKNYTP